jgi:DnaK suppressor protein
MLTEELKQELKQELEKEKIRLAEELKKIAKPTADPQNYETQIEDIGTDEDENATEVENYVDDLALEQNLESQLRDVDAALEKMAKGTYGICENCNQEIDVERLRAYPAARVCIKCK